MVSLFLSGYWKSRENAEKNKNIFRFIHKFQKLANKGDELRLRHHQRKFLNAIYEFRRIKWDQRKLQEKGNSLLDVGKVTIFSKNLAQI